MTRLVAALALAAAVLVRQLWCSHVSRTARKLLASPADGSPLHAYHCPACGRHWTDFPK